MENHIEGTYFRKRQAVQENWTLVLFLGAPSPSGTTGSSVGSDIVGLVRTQPEAPEYKQGNDVKYYRVEGVWL